MLLSVGINNEDFTFGRLPKGKSDVPTGQQYLGVPLPHEGFVPPPPLIIGRPILPHIPVRHGYDEVRQVVVVVLNPSNVCSKYSYCAGALLSRMRFPFISCE